MFESYTLIGGVATTAAGVGTSISTSVEQDGDKDYSVNTQRVLRARKSSVMTGGATTISAIGSCVAQDYAQYKTIHNAKNYIESLSDDQLQELTAKLENKSNEYSVVDTNIQKEQPKVLKK